MNFPSSASCKFSYPHSVGSWRVGHKTQAGGEDAKKMRARLIILGVFQSFFFFLFFYWPEATPTQFYRSPRNKLKIEKIELPQNGKCEIKRMAAWKSGKLPRDFYRRNDNSGGFSCSISFFAVLLLLWLGRRHNSRKSRRQAWERGNGGLRLSCIFGL